MVFHKINAVTAIKPLSLVVQFAEGTTKCYDVRQLFDRWSVFRVFESDFALFSRVRVDVGGHGVVWNDDLDLSCNELFKGGQTIDTEFDGLMACSDAAALWHLDQSTLRKAIAFGRLKSGTDVCKYGKQWVVSKRAMVREFGSLDSETQD